MSGSTTLQVFAPPSPSPAPEGYKHAEKEHVSKGSSVRSDLAKRMDAARPLDVQAKSTDAEEVNMSTKSNPADQMSPVDATRRATTQSALNGSTAQGMDSPSKRKPNVAIPEADSNSHIGSDAQYDRHNSQSAVGQHLASNKKSGRASLPNLVPSRPAPPSPISASNSRRGSKALSTASSTHSTQIFPSRKTSRSSLRKPFARDIPTMTPTSDSDDSVPLTRAAGHLGSSPPRQQSSLAITFTNPFPSASLPSTDSLSRTQVPHHDSEDPLSTRASGSQVGLSSEGMSLDAIRRNFSSTSASTSGGSTASSTPSNALLRHFNELQAAYGITASSNSPRNRTNPSSGVATPSFSARRSIAQNMFASRAKEYGEANILIEETPTIKVTTPVVNEEERLRLEAEAVNAWTLEHPTVVQDFAYDVSHDMFNMVPYQTLPVSLRQVTSSAAVEEERDSDGNVPARLTRRRRKESKFDLGGGTRETARQVSPPAKVGYSWGANYGSRHLGEIDIDDVSNDDEDGWGPMGSVSGGPKPLGITFGGGSRRGLKNNKRQYAGIGGSSGMGGRYQEAEVSTSEGGESSEVGYDEDGVEDEDDFDQGGHTPSKSYYEFIDDQHEERQSRRADGASAHAASLVHDEAGLDGVEADEDSDEGESTDYEDGAHPRRNTRRNASLDEEQEELGPKEFQLPSNHFRPGVYRAIYKFSAEDTMEMDLEVGQLVKVTGPGGQGWAIALREWGPDCPVFDTDRDESSGLVPFEFLEAHQLNDLQVD